MDELELRNQVEEPLLVLPVRLLKAQDVGVMFLGKIQFSSALMTLLMVCSARDGK